MAVPSDQSNHDAMLTANHNYAAKRPPYIERLGLPPSKSYLILTCMDARIDPAAAFGIGPGDAHVIRNAGGSAVAALRDIIISTHFLGVKEVFIIKHKGCVMHHLNSQEKSIFEQLYPNHVVCPGAASIRDMSWHDFGCPFGAVRRDWWFVQNHPAIRANDPGKPERDITIRGYVYDPATGVLEEVQPRVPASQNPAPGSQPNGPDPVEAAPCGSGSLSSGRLHLVPPNNAQSSYTAPSPPQVPGQSSYTGPQITTPQRTTSFQMPSTPQKAKRATPLWRNTRGGAFPPSPTTPTPITRSQGTPASGRIGSYPPKRARAPLYGSC